MTNKFKPFINIIANFKRLITNRFVIPNMNANIPPSFEIAVMISLLQNVPTFKQHMPDKLLIKLKFFIAKQLLKCDSFRSK